MGWKRGNSQRGEGRERVDDSYSVVLVSNVKVFGVEHVISERIRRSEDGCAPIRDAVALGLFDGNLDQQWVCLLNGRRRCLSWGMW